MIAGVVLTGGASRRMGTDKALIEIDGVTFAARVARALGGAGCDPVWCQGGDASALAAAGLVVRPDTNPGAGPLAGILDAYDALGELAPGADAMVVAACDLPHLEPAAVAALLGATVAARPAALATQGAPHLVSWWPAGLNRDLAGLFEDGLRSYRDALRALDGVLVEVAPGAVRNVNRPGDL